MAKLFFVVLVVVLAAIDVLVAAGAAAPIRRFEVVQVDRLQPLEQAARTF